MFLKIFLIARLSHQTSSHRKTDGNSRLFLFHQTEMEPPAVRRQQLVWYCVRLCMGKRRKTGIYFYIAGGGLHLVTELFPLIWFSCLPLGPFLQCNECIRVGKCLKATVRSPPPCEGYTLPFPEVCACTEKPMLSMALFCHPHWAVITVTNVHGNWQCWMAVHSYL